jgi:hypothetical protein
MLTAVDEDLLGIANRSDPMGVLSVWSERARDLVPHLTEQTLSVRGFQVLVEAFRLWERYEPAHPAHAGRLADFFVLIEQAFARTVGARDNWPLPGARRVRARKDETPHISLADRDWHLLGAQRATGLWALYRGASRRAGLLTDDLSRLSDATLAEATGRNTLVPRAQQRLFALIASAMDGETVALPSNLNNALTRYLHDTFRVLPLADHLQQRLIDEHPLNRLLAQRLLAEGDGELDHRRILADAARDLPEHRTALEDAIRCEDLLAVAEAALLWLCAAKGKSVADAAADLPIDLTAFERARAAFGHSGRYTGPTATARHAGLHERLDTRSRELLLRSVLRLHEAVSRQRRRAAWVWEDVGVLHSDVDIDRPPETDLQVGLAWRNDYYLYPLQRIARQLAAHREDAEA